MTRRARASLVLAAILALGGRHVARADDARARRLQALQREMARLQAEMLGLAARESGLLGEVMRMDADIALREAQLEEVSLRLGETEERLQARENDLAVVEAAQARRAPRLAAVLREMYKRGPVGLLARALDPPGGTGNLDGFRYASYLTRRDAAQLVAWRTASRDLQEERGILSGERSRLASLVAETSRKEAALRAGRASRASLLERIRGDREQHAAALHELEEAARNLGRLVDSFEGSPARFALDPRKFRGLLDWPAEGNVSAEFGTVVHPRFKTAIPHPGLDIDASAGEPFRTIFDGRVAYAASLHGYGLTVVVDHGNGIVSIYAHAEALLVAVDQEVARGQEIGRIGNSGSLRGSYLYFELRDAGKPVDPRLWLRPR